MTVAGARGLEDELADRGRPAELWRDADLACSWRHTHTSRRLTTSTASASVISGQSVYTVQEPGTVAV